VAMNPGQIRSLRAESETYRAESGACRAGSEACRAGRTAAGGHDSLRDRGRLVRRLRGRRHPGQGRPAVPLWLVAVIGLAIGAAVFVFVDRYPQLPRGR
jgi:hypothetical protein